MSLLIVAFIVILTGCSPKSSEVKMGLGESAFDPSGARTSTSLHTVMVTSHRDGIDSNCSGTIIHPSWILYAAHCPRKTGTRVTVSLGFSKDQVEMTQPGRAIVHPSFVNSPLKNDIALVKLDQPIRSTSFSQATILHPSAPLYVGDHANSQHGELDKILKANLAAFQGNNDDPARLPFINVGFGKTPDGKSRIFQQAEVPIYGKSIEGKHFILGMPPSLYPYLPYLHKKKGICGGDSGGSSFKRMVGNSFALAGVLSASLGVKETDCGPGQTLVTSVQYHFPWILGAMGKDKPQTTTSVKIK